MTHDKKEQGDEQAKKAASSEDKKSEKHEGMPLDDIKLNEDGGTVDKSDK